MKTFYILCAILVIVVSAIIAWHGDVALASYLIQVQILATLLHIKYNKEE